MRGNQRNIGLPIPSSSPSRDAVKTRRGATSFVLLAALALLAVAALGRAQTYDKPHEGMTPYIPSLVPNCVVGPTQLCVPLDATFNTVTFSQAPCSGPANPADPCQRNDDDFSHLVALPFTFTLYNNNYTSCYINNNGNVSFGNGYCTFTSTGFPVGGFPMVAPFWADVDTRNGASGVVQYKVEPHRMIVVWERVGYYAGQADKRNTFELIMSDGTDPLVGLGNNVCFCYDDMQWTTGSASGGVGGFGGTPATVGVNAGDGVHFFQIGRFNHAGADYDGPGGNNDGVDYLDYQHYCADVTGTNIPPIPQGFPDGFTTEVCAGQSLELHTQFTSPELGQITTTTVDLMGLANASATSVPGNPSSQTLFFTPAAGQVNQDFVVRYTATDDGVPPRTTVVDLRIHVCRGNIVCTDAQAPPATDLSATCAQDRVPGNVCADLSWTAPADPILVPDASGTECEPATQAAASYDIRWSDSPIATDADFDAANQVLSEPVPAAPGTAESFSFCVPPRGVFYVALKSTDPVGNVSSLSSATVLCNRDPVCDRAVASQPVLWPPNHTYHAIDILGVTDPDGDPVTITVTGVTQDEPLNTRGDGNTCPDARIADGQVSVRAERTGTPGVPGNGRVYAIGFRADDGRGGSCTGTVTVCVPHDMDDPTCMDDGQRYVSNGNCRSEGLAPEALELKVAGLAGTEATIEFALPAEADVELAVFDVVGRRLATVESTRLPAGVYSRSWRTTGVPKGLYFVRLKAAGTTLSKTVIKTQ